MLAHVTSTRKEQKLATRNALREAARACFAELGYGATQIAHITERAGVAKGTFYVHFADKDVLLDEWLGEFNEGLVARILPVVEKNDPNDLDLLVAGIAGAFLDHWSANRDFVRAYAEKASTGLRLEELQSGINPQAQIFLRTALERFAAELGGRLEAPDLVIQGLLALWQRLGLQFLFNPRVTREQVVRALVSMTTGALRASVQNR